MPYVIVYEDGQNVELRSSFDSTQGNILFSKLGLNDRTKTASKKRDLPDIKCEYFTILERSGFQLVSSNACNDPTLTGKNRIIREYIFHKEEDTHASLTSSTSAGFQPLTRDDGSPTRAASPPLSRSCTTPGGHL